MYIMIVNILQTVLIVLFIFYPYYVKHVINCNLNAFLDKIAFLGIVTSVVGGSASGFSMAGLPGWLVRFTAAMP